MSTNVQVDAQYSVARVVRPFAGFERRYQGQAITIPIVFPGTLDDNAGKPGFSPYLLKGLPVPLGAQVQLWFPAVVGSAEGEPVIDYKYVLIWRLRNIGDLARSGGQQPYHLRKEGYGAPDTLLAPDRPNRVVLPAATETVIYQQIEPTASAPLVTAPGAGLGNLRTDALDVPSDLSDNVSLFPTVGLPLLPPGSPPFAGAFPDGTSNTDPLGAYQQGVLDPNESNQAPYAIFRPYFTIAKGDEMLIACYRNNSFETTLTWDFATVDQQFSDLYGTDAYGTPHAPYPDLGIYLFTGSAIG